MRESFLDRSRTLDAALVLEDLPEEEEDPWSEGDASRNAREHQEWRPVRQLHVSSEEALSNNSDMQLVFFGTSAGRMSRFRCAFCRVRPTMFDQSLQVSKNASTYTATARPSSQRVL